MGELCLLDEGVSVEQEGRSEHPSSVQENKHFVDWVRSVFSVSDSEEFSDSSEQT